MPTLWLIVIVLILAAVGYVAGRQRSLSSVDGDVRRLHSLPSFYGWNAALWALLPALLALVAWQVMQPVVLNLSTQPMLELDAAQPGALGLAMADVRRVADGLDLAVQTGLMSAEGARGIAPEEVRAQLGGMGIALGSDVTPQTLAAAQHYRGWADVGQWLETALVLLLSVGGLALAWRATNAEFRARNSVERVARWALIAAACIAILTTVGIVLSLIFNTIKFFGLYPASEFFFGTTWSPSFGGSSSLGILPLLWGTLYISFVALVVAVPIGLFSAVYLSEYASPRMRALVKPALEILAGIPTIVYGLFALLTVGPVLMSVFGQGGVLGVTWMGGGTAVMTAGLVMGIMLIPFVSSLSDDIINAVPQSMRDGSLGLGATPSETVRQVVLPAALPGIVGAILLAASRAIGETMIVVLGAGAAANLSLNPLEAMTTVTAKIVSQLTGDADFSSPEALVAFALGMTLFVITLGLNVFALWIVRRYREQYE
ncbi:phosphate ABC transporter permease subunit PstC [Wenxinia marina]|uniref:Phosphate transport system permease protein n=1 Tax=Wenxinia marina DSM 24838 TaxID=1123501 RepID=A0A0D0P838_9RHOB|nr:phosphate ABC transporter permease subunit PstC [Wenxinia marina]KIQ67706.1 phosphate ABC transporter membrane protein 1, PhoT family [Wenxinia marina DSM 24838]GGL77807.1 phosphate transport system permease protein [Wenxinia marina]